MFFIIPPGSSPGGSSFYEIREVMLMVGLSGASGEAPAVLAVTVE